jgi:polysaccharide export outer membrane protein
MKKTIYFGMFLFFVLMAGMVPASFAQDYIIGEGDLIRISVYENDDLITQARVSGEGVINFPLVGTVSIGGLTVPEAEKKIEAQLSQGYIINPHVAIFIAEYRSRKVTLLGEVNKPGIVELSGNVTLLEGLSKAEGLTQNAGDSIVIKRKTKDGKDGEYITINLKDLTEKGDPASNPFLLDGDSVFITKSGFVYVTGEVNKPGAYKVEKDTTVLKAIALAGGLTDKAAPKRTEMNRKQNGEDKKFKVQMGDLVQPDDVIEVPESFF